jgi:hypothetical protein
VSIVADDDDDNVDAPEDERRKKTPITHNMTPNGNKYPNGKIQHIIAKTHISTTHMMYINTSLNNIHSHHNTH